MMKEAGKKLMFNWRAPGCLLLLACLLKAQDPTLSFFEGSVFLDSRPVVRHPGVQLRLPPGSTILTEAGRAEIFLNPNAILRLGENSVIRLLPGDLLNRSLELLGGSALLSSPGPSGSVSMTVLIQDIVLRISKPGRYRLVADSPEFRKGASVVRQTAGSYDRLLDLWSDERDSLHSGGMTPPKGWGPPLFGTPTSSALTGFLPLAVPGLRTRFDDYGRSPRLSAASVFWLNSFGRAAVAPGAPAQPAFQLPPLPRLHAPVPGYQPPVQISIHPPDPLRVRDR